MKLQANYMRVSRVYLHITKSHHQSVFFSFLFSCYFRNRCVGVETSLRVHNFVYTVQPVPIVGRVDLAAVFLDAVKFKHEQLFFSK